MNRYDDNRGNGSPAPKPGSSMRRLLTDGNPAAPLPPTPPPPTANPGPPPVARRRFSLGTADLSQYIIPAVLVLVLLVGVGVMAYSVGFSRGKTEGNSQRDTFIESRARSWNATATALAGGPTVGPGTPAAATDNAAKPNGYSIGGALLARVDKIEGDKLTLLLLDETGKPSGASLIVNRTKQTQIWRTIPNQPVDLRVGDTVLMAGDRTNDSYDARSIQVLPPNS